METKRKFLGLSRQEWVWVSVAYVLIGLLFAIAG
jgi:hypothetical protein